MACNMTPLAITISDWIAGGDGKVRGADPLGLLGGNVPLSPTGFTASYLSDTSLSLAWTDNATDEVSYELDRSPNGVDTWTALVDPAANATSATDTGLTVDTTYYYRLRAVNASGNSSYATANGTTTVGVTSTPNLFSDGFESADLSASTASPNTINFAWTDANRSSVLYQDGASARRVYPVEFTNEYTDGRDVTAKDGTYSMGVEYAATINMAEQRYIHDQQADEIWLRYWVRVPEDYSHGVIGGTTNNKFLAMWMDGYIQEGTGATVVWSMEDAGGGNSDLYFGHTLAEGGETAALQSTPFIDVTTDRGRWMQVCAHLIFGTEAGGDSTVELYRRWENEPNFTMMHQITNANLTKGTATGWGGGYFMGWANGPYAIDQWWLIDTVELSTGSLL